MEIYENNNILKYSKKNYANNFSSFLQGKNSNSEFPKNKLHFET